MSEKNRIARSQKVDSFLHSGMSRVLVLPRENRLSAFSALLHLSEEVLGKQADLDVKDLLSELGELCESMKTEGGPQ